MKESFSEQIFDSLLAEMLTEQHPPDLTRRIEDAWKREQQAEAIAAPGSAGLVAAELVRSDHACKPDQPQDADVQRKAKEGGSRSESRRLPVQEESVEQRNAAAPAGTWQGLSWRRRVIASFLAVSAALLLVALGLWHARREAVDAIAGPGKNSQPADGTRVVSEGGNVEDAPAVRPEKSIEERPTRPLYADQERRLNPEVLDLQDLPFATNKDSTDAEALATHNRFPKVDALPPDQVVSAVDRKLRTLWRQIGVEPQPELPSPELAQKLHRLLTGDELPESVAESLVSDAAWNRRAWVASIIGTEAFSKYWADRFTRRLLLRSRISPDSEDARAVSRLLVERLQQRKPWNGFVEELLAGELVAEDPANAGQVFVRALAGGGNHRLVRRLGAEFLNVNLACLRCHDDRGEPQEAIPGRQKTYWSLVAMLRGVDVRGVALGERDIVDRESDLFAGDSKGPVVFYDRLGGQLEAAEARLPDGSSWRSYDRYSPRRALGKWLAASRAMDRAVVNQVWSMLHGNPLVPLTPEIDVVATESRREILDFIADQYHAHDRDLKKLVAWIASSESSGRSPVRISPSGWLQADDDQLLAMQLSEMVFAAAPSLGASQESQSLQASLSAAIRWGDWTKGSGGLSRELLGQAGIETAPKSPRRRPSRASPTMPPRSYAIHGEVYTVAERNFVKRLLESDRLSWEQRVQHVVGVSRHEVAGGRIQLLAKELLNNSGGDAERALLHLLWAVSNSNSAQL